MVGQKGKIGMEDVLFVDHRPNGRLVHGARAINDGNRALFVRSP